VKFFISMTVTVLTVILSCSGGINAVEVNGRGDFSFFADIIHIPSDSTVKQLVQIAVPSVEIKYGEYMEGYRARLETKISLEGEDGEVFSSEREIIDLKTASEAKRGGGYLFAVDSFRVMPGEYTLSIQMKDLNDRKFSLLGIFFPSYSSSEAEIEVRVPLYDPTLPFVSKPVFLWGVDNEGGYVPNPMKVYGLINETLTCMIRTVFGEEYLGKTASIAMKIYEGEERFFSDSTSFSIDREKINFLKRLDISRYPSGTYMFVATLYAGDEIVLRNGNFNVVWELRNWKRPDRDKILEAKFAFDEEKYEEFLESRPGSREKMLKEFWKERDPDPSTEINEALEEFRRRIRYCEDWFSSGDERGALTDRGRVYIKFGEPDEIVEGSLPRNRREYVQVLRKLKDKYEIMTFEIGGSLADGTGDPEYSTSMRGSPFLSSGMDVGSYQLWIYSRMGAPVFERDRFMTQQEGMRFLFVDKNGYGRFVLKGSSQIPEDILNRTW